LQRDFYEILINQSGINSARNSESEEAQVRELRRAEILNFLGSMKGLQFSNQSS